MKLQSNRQFLVKIKEAKMNRISGSIDCGGSCEVSGDVKGDIDAGGSVTCGNVSGDIDAGGSVKCRR
jgi:cytoskeletal protein CcmA (bactofilin family)